MSGLYQKYPFVQSNGGGLFGALGLGGGGGGPAFPIGPAGGDLTGNYPDPLVKELSGLGVTFLARQTSKVPSQGGGTFLPSGDVVSVGWKSVQGVALAVTRYGDLYITKDGGNTWFDLGYQLSGATNRDIAYGKINGTNFGWAVISNGKVQFFVDIPANYDGLGNPLQAAWQTMLIPSVSFGADICYSASHGIWFFMEQTAGLKYLPQLVAGTPSLLSVTPQGASGKTGGIFVESSSDRLVYFERGTGRVWWAGASFSSPTDWTQVRDGTTPILLSIYPSMTDVDGVGSGVSVGDTSAFAGDVVISTTDVSDPTKYMMAFDKGTLPDLWDISVDGVNWYGSVVTPTVGQPWLYQLWIGSIPAHRTLIAEKGIVIHQDTILTGVRNASVLGTDSFGKVVIKTPDLTGPIGQELFPFGSYQGAMTLFPNTLGSQGGTRAFAFVAVASFIAHGMGVGIKLVSGIAKFGLCLYDEDGNLLTKTPDLTGLSGRINSGVFTTPYNIVGGRMYYMGIWLEGPSNNPDMWQFYSIDGCSNNSDNPHSNKYNMIAKYPNPITQNGADGTTRRPWMAVFG